MIAWIFSNIRLVITLLVLLACSCYIFLFYILFQDFKDWKEWKELEEHDRNK